MKKITRKAALKHIQNNHGKFFSVVFTKRTTGETREMLCRQGVKKHLAGGAPAYNFADKGLIPVFDMEKMAYRSVPREGITRLKVNGVWFDVE